MPELPDKRLPPGERHTYHRVPNFIERWSPQSFWREGAVGTVATAIGADAYCRDAAVAVETATEMVSARRAAR